MSAVVVQVFGVRAPRAVVYCLLAALIGFDLWFYGSLDWSNPWAVSLVVGVTLLLGLSAGVVSLLFVRAKSRLRIACGMELAYFIIYGVLACNGQYYWSQSGRLRYGGGLSVTDRVVWNPLCMWWEPFRDVAGKDTTRGNLLGYMYSPLIALHRQWFHPTEVLFDETGGGELDSQIDLGRLGVTSR